MPATEEMYIIIGVCQGRKEEIDTAKDKKEADYLVNEYKMAFGKGWRIYKQKSRY